MVRSLHVGGRSRWDIFSACSESRCFPLFAVTEKAAVPPVQSALLASLMSVLRHQPALIPLSCGSMRWMTARLLTHRLPFLPGAADSGYQLGSSLCSVSKKRGTEQ